jgi:hypothetical protein
MKFMHFQKRMNQTPDRAIIRDSYNRKLYEIIQLNNEMFIYDYGLGCFLKGKETTAIFKTVIRELWGLRDRVKET